MLAVQDIIRDMKSDTPMNRIIQGDVGSGKTVLMKTLVGLLDPTSGEVLYDGRDFVQMTKKEKSTKG